MQDLRTPAQGLFNIQQGTTTSENVQVPVFNIAKWLSSGQNNTINSYYPQKRQYDLENAMIRQHKKNLLLGYIQNISLGKHRSYADILEGKECDAEDVFYSFDKWKEVVAGNKVQTFFLQAESEDFVLNDPQVKYGSKYIYQCDGHFLIIGNKYRYENVQVKYDNENNPYYLVEVVNSPNIVMIPLRMFEQEMTVLQPPPLTPEVKFTTEMNSEKEISVYLSTVRGTLIGSFEALFERDQSQLNQLLVNNNYNDIMFRDEAVDESALFEVYYSDTPPKNYLNMTKKTEIRSEVKSCDALYETMIIPNRKVYYMFRKVGTRGFVSNPTPIYEVELILDADDARVVVDTYSFPEYPIKQNSRKFQSLFQIRPAIQHTTFDNSQDFLTGKNSLNGTGDKITLGVAEHAVWGKKFKFRFKSTTTGKILDFNVTFKLTKNKSKEDF